MDLINKFQEDAQDTAGYFTGFNYTKKEKIYISIFLFVAVAANNLLYYFLQDVIVVQSIMIGIYISFPILIKKIIKREMYYPLEIYEYNSHYLAKVWFLLTGLGCIIPILALILGCYFNYFRVNSIVVLAPLFRNVVFQYLYVILASILFCLIHPFSELKFFFKIFNSILPDGTIFRFVQAAILATHYIGFSFAILKVSVNVLISLAVIFLTYILIIDTYRIKDRNVATNAFLGLTTISWALFLFYCLLSSRGAVTGGIQVQFFNPKNIFN